MASDPELGGVSPSEIAGLIRDSGTPGEASATLPTRFARRVSDLVVTRSAKGESGSYTVFLLSEAIGDDLTLNTAAVEMPLLSNGLDPVSNRIILATQNISRAYELPGVWTDSATLFQTVRDSGFGERSTVVIDWREGKPLATLYRQGLNHTELSERVILEDAPITAAEMKEMLDHFHETTLRTPQLIAAGHALPIWEDATKGIPKYRPEEKIQGRLLDALRSRFSRHGVHAEPVVEDGRADIIIFQRTLSQRNMPARVHEWVLELKALCDMTSTGKPATTSIPGAITSGLEQAIAYKANLDAVNAALCCYDMRAANCTDEECFTHVTDDATSNGILLWRWYLYRGSKASREAKGYLNRGSA